MAKFRSNAVVPVTLALAALVGAGCGSEETRAPAPPAAAPAPAPSPAPEAEAPAPSAPAPEATPPAPAAAVPEWQGELPSDFPSDVPPYPGATVSSARGNEELGIVVSFDSSDTIEAVGAFYADSLAAQGWQTETRHAEDGMMILGDKDDRTVRVLVQAGGQGTRVDVITGRAE